MTLNTATSNQTLFAYKLPETINRYVGLVGYLRADYGADGTSFFSSFFDGPYKDKACQKNFKEMFDCFVNELRHLLNSFDQLKDFCDQSTSARFESGLFCGDYLFRQDEGDFTFIVKLIPVQGIYNMYIHCYLKEQLDCYIERSEKGIRFIGPNNRELFKIPNGGQITIKRPYGEVVTTTCYYIDDNHTLIGCNVWHIYEFAEKMKSSSSSYEPVKEETDGQAE